jgi:hypothetical protein
MTVNNPEDTKKTDTDETIGENGPFNVFSFRHYLSKIQSIGISTKSLSNKDFMLFRDLLVSEVNKHDTKIGACFSLLLADKNIMHESIHLFANAYANYTSIFQNYYQYNEQMVKQCMRIGDSYFNDYIKKCENKEMNAIIDEVKKWLQEIIKIIYNP